MDALQNLFGVENNQVLIRKYEITGADIDRYVRLRNDEEGGNIVTFWFIKYPHAPDDTNTYEFIDISTLKEYFIHLLEEPVDDITWLRIKQPGTYTIHFALILSGYIVLFYLSYTQKTK